MKRKEIVAEYFYNQINFMENEVQELQRRIRTRHVGVEDSYELQYALVRLELMKQVRNDISVFLRIENNVIK